MDGTGRIGEGTASVLNRRGRAIRPRKAAAGNRRRRRAPSARVMERLSQARASQVLALAKTAKPTEIHLTFKSGTADPEYTFVIDHQEEAEAEATRALRRLGAAIDSLQPKLRAVIRARLNRRSLGEIANSLKIGKSTAGDRLQAALNELGRLLRPQDMRILLYGLPESAYVTQRNTPWGDSEAGHESETARKRNSDHSGYVDERSKDSKLYGDGVAGVYITGRKHKQVRGI